MLWDITPVLLCVIFIDFKKSFALVSHPSLIAATRLGFPLALSELVTNLYNTASMNIIGNTFVINIGDLALLNAS